MKTVTSIRTDPFIWQEFSDTVKARNGKGNVSATLETLIKNYIDKNADKNKMPKSGKDILTKLTGLNPFFLDYPEFFNIHTNIYSTKIIEAAVNNKDVFNFLASNKEIFYELIGVEDDIINIETFANLFTNVGREYYYEKEERVILKNEPHHIESFYNSIRYDLGLIHIEEDKVVDDDLTLDRLNELVETTILLIKTNPLTYTVTYFDDYDKLQTSDWIIDWNEKEALALIDAIKLLIVQHTTI